MISPILPIDDIKAIEKALEINRHLKDHCKSYNFVYMDNSNLTSGDLYDAVHPTREGREVLVNNFSFYMNKHYSKKYKIQEHYSEEDKCGKIRDAAVNRSIKLNKNRSKKIFYYIHCVVICLFDILRPLFVVQSPVLFFWFFFCFCIVVQSKSVSRNCVCLSFPTCGLL